MSYTVSTQYPSLATLLRESGNAYVGNLNNTLTLDANYYVTRMLPSTPSEGSGIWVGSGIWYFDFTLPVGYKILTTYSFEFGIAWNSTFDPNALSAPGSVNFTFEGSTESSFGADVTGGANFYPPTPNNYLIQTGKTIDWGAKTNSTSITSSVKFDIYMNDPAATDIFGPGQGEVQFGIDYVRSYLTYDFLDDSSLFHTDY